MICLLPYALAFLPNLPALDGLPPSYVALTLRLVRPLGLEFKAFDPENERLRDIQDADADFEWAIKTTRRGPPQHGERIPLPKP